MAAYNKFNSFVEDIAEGVHNLQTGALTVALCAAANAPVATNTVLANLTQISYTNLSGRVITVSASAQASGTYKLTCTDLVLTATGVRQPKRCGGGESWRNVEEGNREMRKYGRN